MNDQAANTNISNNIQDKNVCSYELTILVYSYLNDDIVNEITNTFSENFKEKFYFKQSSSIGRYDVLIKKKKTKVSMYNIIFACLKSQIIEIKSLLKSNKSILKYLIIKEGNKMIDKVFNYKYPIEMKKYMFESMRIMPIELN